MVGNKILVSEYKLFKRSNKANLFDGPGPVACFSDEDDVSGNQNNCYWPLHSESIAKCIKIKKLKMSIILLSMCDVKIFLTFTSPNMVLL
jgi:hypothetical protein